MTKRLSLLHIKKVALIAKKSLLLRQARRTNNLNRMHVGYSSQEAETENCERAVGGETPASTFDREFRSYVASKGCIADRGTECWFAGGISAAGSASWIASCPRCVRFSANVTGICRLDPCSARPGVEGGARSWCETVFLHHWRGWVKRKKKNPAGISDATRREGKWR